MSFRVNVNCSCPTIDQHMARSFGAETMGGRIRHQPKEGNGFAENSRSSGKIKYIVPGRKERVCLLRRKRIGCINSIQVSLLKREDGVVTLYCSSSPPALLAALS